MGLINCPDCGKQISEHAITCPFCGSPINAKQADPEPVKDSKVTVKIPSILDINVNIKMKIKQGGNTLWEGYAGEVAKFDLGNESNVDFYCYGVRQDISTGMLALMILLCFTLIGMIIPIIWFFVWLSKKSYSYKMLSQKVEPGKKYEWIIVKRYGSLPYGQKNIFKLSEVDVIDSRD